MQNNTYQLPKDHFRQASASAIRTMPAHEAVIEVLKEQGVDTIFGYPGGAIMPIYDGLEKVPHNMTHILTAAEGGAGHMATGYARASGKTGVLFVTSGPGFTNAVTPMADAQGDSVPMVVISGQVARSLIGTDAFQEVDATGISRPITKHNMLINDPARLVSQLRQAFRLAADGRPGVVHVDIPKDVQNADVTFGPEDHGFMSPGVTSLPENYHAAVQMMRQARKPVFYVGGGVINAGAEASATLVRLLNETGFPATSTLMGLGAYPTTHRAHMGMLGMHGTYEANMAMHDADLIIAVGARFDDRVTGKVKDENGKRLFAPHARIIHIDVDPAEMNKIVPADISLYGDAAYALHNLREAWRAQPKKPAKSRLKNWWAQINAWRQVRSLDIEAPNGEDIRAQHVMMKLGEHLVHLPDYTLATNVGQHQMWAAQYLPFKKPRQLMTSGKVGTMGYGLPAAIGAKRARPDAPAIMITGDGSWRMNTPEVETACRYDLPVKIVMLNNNSLNMVGQWQRGFHGGRMSQSTFANSSKDFCAEFRAQGANAKAERVSDPADLDAAMKRMMAYNDGPYFLEIKIRNEDCLPMMPAGSVHNHMLLSPEASARLKGLAHG